MGSAPSSLLHRGVPRPPALVWDHQAGRLGVSLAWELQYQCLGNPAVVGFSQYLHRTSFFFQAWMGMGMDGDGTG